MNNLAFQIYGSKKTGIFQSTWKTDNISTGSSASNQITLPLLSGGTYNFWIDWGDGNVTNVTSYSQIYSGETLPRTHTYTSLGTYTIRITGVCTGWYFNNTGDRLKILSISSWGILKLGTVGGGCFYGCANLNLSSVTDVLNLTGTTQLSSCFRLCTTLTAVNRMNEWDLSTVTRIDGMFLDATNFNQNIGNWNVSNVTNMGSVFANCILFNQNLGSWNTISVTSMSNMFQKASVFNNGLASGVTGTMNWNTSNVITMANMFINALAFNQNISTWNTIKVTSMASMFSRSDSGTYNFNQNIGAWNVSSVTDFSSMFQNTTLFNNGESSDINNWTLKTTGTISMASMFSSTLAFNQPIGNWNMSNVVNMDRMFYLASKFNNGYASGDGIGNQLTWNTSTCTNMNGMFNSAVAFNSNLGTGTTPWDVSKVTDMSFMFGSATAFNNGYLSGVAGSLPWITTNCTNMSFMFKSASKFNQCIGTFDVSKVTTFNEMLNGASVFNNGDNSAPINNWSINTVSNVSMYYMFAFASSFNRDISGWNMTKVTNTNAMFYQATVFNQPLANWERVGSTLANVTNMQSMFQNIFIFNQPIGNWNVSGVTTMLGMFNFTNFNQDISSWNVGNVTNMSSMFLGATAFNQNIGSWNVSNVTNFSNFMGSATFSSTNLDAIYNGWSTQTLQHTTPITISFGTAKYSSAGAAGRLILTSAPNNWTITDGLLTVSGTSNNGGLIRVTTSAAHGFTTGNVVYIYGVGGTTNANGTWTVTVISTTIIQLQGSTYNSAWTSGGNIILG